MLKLSYSCSSVTPQVTRQFTISNEIPIPSEIWFLSENHCRRYDQDSFLLLHTSTQHSCGWFFNLQVSACISKSLNILRKQKAFKTAFVTASGKYSSFFDAYRLRIIHLKSRLLCLIFVNFSNNLVLTSCGNPLTLHKTPLCQQVVQWQSINFVTAILGLECIEFHLLCNFSTHRPHISWPGSVLHKNTYLITIFWLVLYGGVDKCR